MKARAAELRKGSGGSWALRRGLGAVGRVRGLATQSFTNLDGDRGWRHGAGTRKVGHGGLPIKAKGWVPLMFFSHKNNRV